MKALQAQAPAKVNLMLEVLGRYPNGYHQVLTILHALALADTLVVESQASGLHLQMCSETSTGSPVVAGEDNLVLRAARSFLAAAQLSSGFRFHLTKRIPAGGGLGGGSSDAATALLLMNELSGQPLSAEQLLDCARGLGADVPFFLAAGTQVGRGVGDQLQPMAQPPCYHFLLILPAFGTSTPAVYKNLGPQLTLAQEPASILADKALSDKELAVPRGFPNHLETSAMQLYPGLMQIQRRIQQAGFTEVRMSGSGSTLFLAFADEAACQQACATLAADPAATFPADGVQFVVTRSGPQTRAPARCVPFPAADLPGTRPPGRGQGRS